MKNLWLSKDEIAKLPTSGAAFDSVKAAADSFSGGADLSNQDSALNVQCLAAALIYAATGQATYKDKVLAALTKIANGVPLGRALALGSELAAYVISADLIDLETLNPALHTKFSTAILDLLTADTPGGGPKNLSACQDERPNNWGTHARASITAVGLYLGERSIVDRSATIFKGWLGDRSAYAGFTYGFLGWQADEAKPVGINPKGATKQGHSIDGGQPEELRRPDKEPFVWPPSNKDQRMYTWESLQGAFLQAQLLYRNGYPDVYDWCDQALLRAVKFAYAQNWPAGGDDGWQLWLINSAYGTDYPALPTATPGKNFGWTQWTNATGIKPPPPPDNTDAQKVAAAKTILLNAKTALADGLAKVDAALTVLGG